MTLQGACGGITEVGCESIQIQDEGVSLGSAFILNFTGTGVTASLAGDTATINVTGGGGSGSVESVAVVSANGFKGSVASATTTPKITIDVSALNAVKIANGTVSNTEFQYLDGVTGAIQTQLNVKVSGTGASTDNAVIRWDGTGGNAGQNSGVIIDDSDNITGASSIVVPSSGLRVLGSASSFYYAFRTSTQLVANRTFSLNLGNANRTLSMSGDLTVTSAASVEGVNTGDQFLFSTIAVAGQSNVVADTTGDTLTFEAGTGITITTSAANDTIFISATGGGTGTVTNVSIVSANGFFGSVASATSTPKITIDVSGLPTSKIAGGAFGRAFFATATTAAATNFLGAGAVGTQVFQAATTAAAQDALGGGTFGKLFFSTTTTAAAQAMLEGGAVGLQVFKTATTAAAQSALGAGTFGANFFSVATTAAAQNMLEAGTVGLQVFKTATTAAAQQALGGGTVGRTIFEAVTTAAVNAIIDASAKQNIIQYQDEGVGVGTAGGIVTVNFTGPSVVASATGSVLTVRCSAAGGGGGTPGGSNTYVQFNDSSAFGGVSDFTWDKTTQVLTVSDTSLAGPNVVKLYATNGNSPYVSVTNGTSTGSLNSDQMTISEGSDSVVVTKNAVSVSSSGNGASIILSSGGLTSTVSEQGASLPIGSATSNGNVPVKANSNTTAVGNVGAGTDDLITYSLPSDSLSSDGRGVRITAWGSTANNGNAKTLTMNWGSTTIFSRSMTISANNRWTIVAVVFRTGSNAQDYAVLTASDGATNVTPAFGTSTQTNSGAITIKCTGNATSNNDVVQEGMLVEMIN